MPLLTRRENYTPLRLAKPNSKMPRVPSQISAPRPRGHSVKVRDITRGPSSCSSSACTLRHRAWRTTRRARDCPFARLELAERDADRGLREAIGGHRDRLGSCAGADRLDDVALHADMLGIAIAREQPLERAVARGIERPRAAIAVAQRMRRVEMRAGEKPARDRLGCGMRAADAPAASAARGCAGLRAPCRPDAESPGGTSARPPRVMNTRCGLRRQNKSPSRNCRARIASGPHARAGLR